MNVGQLATRLRGIVGNKLTHDELNELKWTTAEPIICSLFSELGIDSLSKYSKERDSERRVERREGVTREEKIALERAHRDMFARMTMKELEGVGLGQLATVPPGRGNPLADRKFCYTLFSLLLQKVGVLACERSRNARRFRTRMVHDCSKQALVASRRLAIRDRHLTQLQQHSQLQQLASDQRHRSVSALADLCWTRANRTVHLAICLLLHSTIALHPTLLQRRRNRMRSICVRL